MKEETKMEPTNKLIHISDFKNDEQIYLKFVYDTVQQKIVNKVSPIFIVASEQEQEKFMTFMNENYKDHCITDPNYSIRKTLNNVWKIIKFDLDKVLESNDLKNEKQCQSTAYRDGIKQGKFGKVLTARQARIFILFAQKVEIPYSKKFIGIPLSPITYNEKLYLQFVVKNVRDSLNDKCNLIFLGATEKMQIDFISYARMNNVPYTRKNLNFLGVINAITFRVQTELKKTIDPMYLEEESRQQKLADAELLNLNKIYKGRMLTKRQAGFLIDLAK